MDTINYLLISKEEIEDEEIKSFYDSLSEKIYLFLGEIKSSSFENTIFNRIKNIMNDITDFVQSTDLKMDKIKNPNNDLSQNMAYNEEYDRINNIHNNFSYLNYSKLEEKNNPNNLSFNESRLSHLGSSMKHDFLNIEQEEDFMIINESLCQKNNINKNNTNNYKTQIIEKIKEKYNYISYYANILIKDESFNKETPENIKKQFPECRLLYDFKKIQNELLINQCKISANKFDFNYNFINIPNLALKFKRGGEKYYPPYGWIGIGLNIKNIYNNVKENKEKANCYYAFKNINCQGIKNMLNKIIMHEGLVIDQNLQPKCGFLNKRNKNNNVGNGIYLSPNISIVEQKTGIVFLDDKAYKIALMARVLSDKIRQPDNNDWILNTKEIEFTRILFKEIHL